MPNFYSFYEDFILNKSVLNIEEAASTINVPFLQIHGDMDTSVSISEGQQIAHWTGTELAIIKGGDHTFGASHPWTLQSMPEDFQQAIDRISIFLDEVR